jgi:homoserine O-succinyltransferase/O-acetyltransferase
MGSAIKRECVDTSGHDDLIVIGLINNMSDAALHTTEMQFRALLSASSFGARVCVRSFFLPDIARSARAAAYLQQYHEPIANLWDSRLDGLIVTGAEPRAPLLTDEAYWDSLVQVVDWAENNTVSTIWSCLAAHAAVLRLDGIHRQSLGGKLYGVFGCRKMAEHPILAGVPSSWRVPHSRLNHLPEAHLRALGYQMLSSSDEAGVDIFVRQRDSLFVFLQGHPEYDPLALFREYRRDILRYLSGQRDIYPDMPLGYFNAETAQVMETFHQNAVRHRRVDLLESFPVAIAGANLVHAWQEPAARIFANWLFYLASRSLRCAVASKFAPVAMQLSAGR